MTEENRLGDLKMAEMSSSLGPGFVLKTIGDFLDEVSGIADAPGKMSKVDDLVIKLEVEMKKLDAFKLELPLCTLLLNDAISGLKECLRLESEKAGPHLVEYIPMTRESDESDDGDGDKKNWMKSVQLWHSGYRLEHGTKDENNKIMNEDESRFATVDLDMVPKPGKDRSEKSSSSDSIKSENDELSSWHGNLNRRLSQKQRRCWSPELHELFVDSLQKLGGAQVATPKQIRDLMQVDGLTNDEVKSHLQKYRLHVRATTNQSGSRSWLGSSSIRGTWEEFHWRG